MPVALKLLGVKTDTGQMRAQVQFTLSGVYPAGGDIVDLTTLIGQGAGSSYVFVANNPPLYGVAQGSTGDDYNFIPGTQLNNGKLKVNTSSNTELSGAYPARILADVSLFGELVFNSLL
jgi:hypothetical protein